MFLDSFVEDLQRNHGDEIPKDFDEQAFRDGRRQEAERQSRWMLVKEQIVEDLGLEVTDEDRESHFELSAGDGGIDAGLLRKYYESVSGMMNRLDSRLLTDKVFETLLADVELEEKDSESYKAEFEAQAS
jgi:FKBP-type peptidyl-prolyl cis-trans isomerase (trigger factor)